jgi:hypothetical protein
VASLAMVIHLFYFHFTIMQIKLQEGLAEIASLAISSIAILLHELFGSHVQVSSLEAAEKVSTGPVILPILACGPKAIKLKTTAIKNTFCNGRLAVYSKQLNDVKECCRFVHKERHLTKEKFIAELPVALREATFAVEDSRTLLDFIIIIANIPSDRVAFFYDPEPCEGTVTHCIGIIHEFGEETKPYCVATTYLSIEINK